MLLFGSCDKERLVYYEMITHHKVDGYDNFVKLMRFLDCKGKVMLYFHGSSDPAGMSWSTACNTSGPVILEMLKQNESQTLHFVTVGVGTFPEWKESKCPFRTDSRVLLKKLPTIMWWRSDKRLSGNDCANPEKVKRLLQDLK